MEFKPAQKLILNYQFRDISDGMFYLETDGQELKLV
jgi:hypothetical protein